MAGWGGVERSDDYKAGATLDQLQPGSVVREDVGLAKMGDGYFTPVRRVAIVQAIHAVPRAKFYFKKLLGDSAEKPAEKPVVDKAKDVRVRLGDDDDDDDGEAIEDPPAGEAPPVKAALSLSCACDSSR